MNVSDPRGLHTRGYLPHVDVGSRPQFVTFRLADSLPAEILKGWIAELEPLPEGARRKALHRRIESYLDEGHGSAILKNPIAAIEVMDAFCYVHCGKATVHAFAVMPNHVHAALTPNPGNTLGSVMGPLKGFTAYQIHRKLGMKDGRLWEPESYDRYARDDRHFIRIVEYIEWNPVKAGLCANPKNWAYSTANEKVRQRLKMREEEGRRSSAG